MSSDPERDVKEAHYSNLCRAVGYLILSFGRIEGVMSSELKVHLAINLGPRVAMEQGAAVAAAIFGSMRYLASRDAITDSLK